MFLSNTSQIVVKYNLQDSCTWTHILNVFLSKDSRNIPFLSTEDIQTKTEHVWNYAVNKKSV